MTKDADLVVFEQWVEKYGGEIGGKPSERFYAPPAPLAEHRPNREVRLLSFSWLASRGEAHDYFTKPERALNFAMLIRSSLRLPDGSVLSWERHKPTRWCCWVGPKEKVFNVPDQIIPYCIDWAFEGMPAEMLADKLLEILP